MIELELKAVVPDLTTLIARLRQLGARESFVGQLEDRRFDTPKADLLERGETLRVRVYRAPPGRPTASLDWKGAVSVVDGYKQREELSVAASDPDALITILGRLRYTLTMSIDRDIWQYELDGAVVRLERYPRMDDLVEVEGEPSAIEAAIARLAMPGLPRTAFTGENLMTFVERFERRAGTAAILSR